MGNIPRETPYGRPVAWRVVNKEGDLEWTGGYCLGIHYEQEYAECGYPVVIIEDYLGMVTAIWVGGVIFLDNGPGSYWGLLYLDEFILWVNNPYGRQV